MEEWTNNIISDYMMGNIDGIEYRYRHLVQDEYFKELDIESDIHEKYSFILTSIGETEEGVLAQCSIVPVFETISDIVNLLENTENMTKSISIIRLKVGKGIKISLNDLNCLGLVKLESYLTVKTISLASILNEEHNFLDDIKALEKDILYYSIYPSLENNNIKIAGINETAEIHIKNQREFCLYTAMGMLEKHCRFEAQSDEITYINKYSQGCFIHKETKYGNPYIVIVHGYKQYYIRTYGDSNYIRRFEVTTEGYDKKVLAIGTINVDINNLTLRILDKECDKILIKTGLFVWVYKCIYGRQPHKVLTKLAS
ncbi:hypothetical protein [uncultured Clostridium sp.]|uniref:hypothetical protein n=1 Tax=uncultured Clostridium sp. TaxID=59620 RepID=UPI0026F3B8E2|nr:hypothetical protein [uncultured Clostridium sp.]